MSVIKNIFRKPKSTKANEVYIMSWDTSVMHEDDESICSLVKFEGCENITGWQSTRDIEVPEEIYFEGNIDTLQKVDFPYNDVSWPIMSKKMLNLIKQIDPNIKIREIPLYIIDDTVMPKDRTDDNGNIKDNILNKDFAVIQVLEYSDVFDWENSEYKQDEDDPEYVDYVHKLVLKIPKDGFSPFFRMEPDTSYMFISGEVKEIFEQNGIIGVTYEKVDMR